MLVREFGEFGGMARVQSLARVVDRLNENRTNSNLAVLSINENYTRSLKGVCTN